MGKTYLYCRVSTLDQDTTIQARELSKAFPDGRLFEEKHTGTTMDRPVLQEILRHLDEGDTLVVWKLDRLGRSTWGALTVLQDIHSKGADIVVLTQPIDTRTPTGKAFFTILATIAELDYETRRERQLLGIARAKEQGVYKRAHARRKKGCDWEKIRELTAQGVSITKTAKACGCSVSTVKNVRRELKNSQGSQDTA